MSSSSKRRVAADATASGMPLQITFRHMDHSPALESRIRVLVARLEKFDAHITHCHVIIAPPPRHHRHGALYDFHIDIGLPEKVIAVRHARSGAAGHEDPFVALRDAFRAVRRKLEDYRRTRRGEIKSHSQPRVRRRTPAD
ncbi:MAG: ribosome-associated translation inhibitor RaiA [Gammaproteobacteria bacterium]|nr:ribosome-associated translation inhibitor RaiA [Gammaproteobacteria bacterium]MBV8306767.1 ribosome-associated translation inhibitor RaiA [Gammaproteobacteria bacterium]MBV8404008.1 ribosome-associated translation inhibitor RaiA [Gammaproteobacteria bacterium]